ELRRQRTRHQLREGHAFLEVSLRDPAALLDQVSVHVAHERNGAAEAPRAQAQHVAHEIPQRVAGGGRRLRGSVRHRAVPQARLCERAKCAYIESSTVVISARSESSSFNRSRAPAMTA